LELLGRGEQLSLMSKELEQAFENLRHGKYKITSVKTPSYNCIAWAAGDSQRRWWPFPAPFWYWPANVQRAATVPQFIEAFETLGYEPCDSSNVESGFEKVAIYVDPAGVPTHMARQEASGKWTSKLGPQEDIEHDTVAEVEGREYGRVVQYLKRVRS
jgi:hypothetical protein